MTEGENRERVEVQGPEDLWTWLDGHHAQPESVWLVTYKRSHGDRYVSRDEVLDALIAYGWIDGRRMKLDEARTMQLIGPRKEQSWAKTYQVRAARLEAEGRMRAPGRAAVERSKASGRWDDMREVDALSVPEDVEAALRARGAWTWWENAAPSYRRNVLRWIAKAKRTATRTKRIDTVTTRAAAGEKVPHY
ncbi:MAG: YdeI/OmpD-associated family protein [Myxococcota bacterium]